MGQQDLCYMYGAQLLDCNSPTSPIFFYITYTLNFSSILSSPRQSSAYLTTHEAHLSANYPSELLASI
ncbi:hypothetical protein ACET3Z_030480 [Daucus carota]